MDDILAMEILYTLCDIERLDKVVMITNAIPDFAKYPYQTNAIGGITVRIHTIPTSQEFHHVPVFHPGRHKAESGFQDVRDKVNAIEG
jgi:hypothetical protein